MGRCYPTFSIYYLTKFDISLPCIIIIIIAVVAFITTNTLAPGSGGSFKGRKAIVGEVGGCDAWMADGLKGG